MKVNIGPYRSDIIPVSSWVRKYEFWRSKDLFYLDEDKWTWYDKLVFAFFDKFEELVRPLNHWSQRRKRKIKVHIDYYDIWSADHTFGIIIAAMLKKLKEHQHGYPHVDNEDVPEELRFELTQEQKDNWDDTVDQKHEARWAYVLDEMIWTFSQYGLEDDTAQYYHNVDQLDMIFTPLGDGKPASTLSFNHQKDPSKPPYYRDQEGLKKHAERKANGRRLFSKYYEALWD